MIESKTRSLHRLVGQCLRAGICATTLAMISSAAAAEQPNILFFLADDQRSDVLGCYGNDLIKTPTIDQLAAEGVRFENSFCEVPICAASRATIFTGLSQRTHGYNFEEQPIEKKHIDTSYPVLLKHAGYRVGFAGKYGVKFAKPDLKTQFDFFKEVNRNPYIKTKGPDKGLHETDICANAAIEFIESTPEGTPFCMSVSFNASHAEDRDRRPGYHFQWPESTDGLYEELEIPAPKLGDENYFKALPAFMQDGKELSRERYFWRWDTPKKYETNMRAYYRMITGIDNAIARILAVLKEKGLDDNTIIIYSADNGFMMGDRGLAGKWNHYEQSLRVPLIIYDPRLPQKQHGRVVTELVNNIDLAPTFVDFADAQIPAVYQGRSLEPLIEGQAVEGRPDIFCEHHFEHYNDWHAVRSKRYKYAVYYDSPYECLFDLEKDPDEVVNLISNPEYADVLKDMQARLDRYLAEIPERELNAEPNEKRKEP